MVKSIQDRIIELTKKNENELFLLNNQKLSDTKIYEKAFENAKNSYYKRNYRTYVRFKAIAKMELPYFITLTYDEKHIKLGKTELAKKWAKEYLTNYYGNDDYGTKNGRYHHHIFGNFKKKIDLDKSWKYGTINIQKMRTNEIQLAKYIKKLSNHAIKDGTSTIFKSKEIYNKFKGEKNYERS